MMTPADYDHEAHMRFLTRSFAVALVVLLYLALTGLSLIVGRSVRGDETVTVSQVGDVPRDLGKLRPRIREIAKPHCSVPLVARAWDWLPIEVTVRFDTGIVGPSIPTASYSCRDGVIRWYSYPGYD